MDIPVFCHCLRTDLSKRSCQCRLDRNTIGSVRGTCISDHLRHIHQLFPDSCCPKTHPSDSGQHVHLCTADHRDRLQHHHRNGRPHMAEDPGSSHGIRRFSHRQLQQEQGLQGTTHICCRCRCIITE